MDRCSVSMITNRHQDINHVGWWILTWRWGNFYLILVEYGVTEYETRLFNYYVTANWGWFCSFSLIVPKYCYSMQKNKLGLTVSTQKKIIQTDSPSLRYE